MNFQKFFKQFLFFAAALVLASCSKEDCGLDHTDQLQGLPSLRAGSFPEEELTVNIGSTHEYTPQVISPMDVYYQWYVNGEDVSTDPTYSFKADRSMRAKVVLELTNDMGKVKLENNVIVPGADYTQGCLVLNEGWFGHESGNVSYYNFEKNSMEHWIDKNQNYGATLGATSQSATLWNGKLYICSKDKNHLVVLDPKTLYIEKSCGILTRYQAYEFIGLNENYGVITHNGYFTRVDLKTFKTVTLMSVGNTWSGTGSGVVYNGKLILNVKGNKLHAIDLQGLLEPDLKPTAKIEFTQLDIYTSGGTRFVTGKDGNLYTAETTKTGENNLVKIKPDFSFEKVPMRTDYTPSSFGTYMEARFCGTPAGDFYYAANGKIYKATFANAAPEKPFTEFAKEGYGFYGAGIRVNPATNELMAMYLTADYKQNLIVRFNAATGQKLSEITYEGYHFPSAFIFN